MKSRTRQVVRKKIWPILVSSGSALVIIVTYFIPSIQDQWDRYQSRQIIERYVALGDDFSKEENYSMAQQAYSRAFELSEEKRLDVEIKRLRSKVNQIYVDLAYGVNSPDSLAEIDFQYLLHMLDGDENKIERAGILTTYGLYVSSLKRPEEAEKTIREAIALNPNDPFAYVSLGTIMYEAGKKEDAQRGYEKAIELDANNFDAHYYLGHLFVEQHKVAAAEAEFQKALKIDSTDSDSHHQLDSLHRERRRNVKAHGRSAPE